MLRSMEISSSALTAQRVRMDVIAGNIANAQVTQQEDGTIRPYRRRFATFLAGDEHGRAGVRIGAIAEDPTPFRLVNDPGHPHADARGYVQFPNVSLTMEYVDALEASRAYEANAAMLQVTRSMAQQALRLFA